MHEKFTRDQAFMFEPIIIKTFRHGQRRRIKTKRADLVMERLDELSGGKSLMWFNRCLRAFTSFENAKSYPKLANKLFVEYKFLMRRDMGFRMLMATEVPHQKKFKVLDRDLNQSIKQFKKIIHAQKLKEKEETKPLLPKTIKRPKSIEAQRRLVYKNKLDYFFDENGRKVWSERAAQAKNGTGISKYFNNKEKIEKYKRGERPRIEE
jgi:hypothetical protein